MELKSRQQQHYDRLYREYEAKTEQSAYMRLMRSKYAFGRWTDRLAGQRVLDLGCGPGDTARRLVAARCSVVGLDLSMQFVRRAREQIAGYDLAGWVQGDAERLPLADGALDVVVSLGTLHHLPHPGQAIAEVARLLRPGGWLLAMEANAAAQHSAIEFYGALMPVALRGRLVAWRAGRQATNSEAEDDELHIGARTPAQYRALLERAGLRAHVDTFILPFFPFTLLGLHRYTATWQVAVWGSRLIAALVPSLRDRGQVQIIEAQKTDA